MKLSSQSMGLKRDSFTFMHLPVSHSRYWGGAFRANQWRLKRENFICLPVSHSRYWSYPANPWRRVSERARTWNTPASRIVLLHLYKTYVHICRIPGNRIKFVLVYQSCGFRHAAGGGGGINKFPLSVLNHLQVTPRLKLPSGLEAKDTDTGYL
jgi:hypothetical protein